MLREDYETFAKMEVIVFVTVFELRFHRDFEEKQVITRMHNRVVRLNKNTQLRVNPRDQFFRKNVHHYHVKE